MGSVLMASIVLLLAAMPVSAQSLFIQQGDRAVEGSVGWAVGPVSQGIETHAAVSVNGRWDVGFGFNWYAADFGGDEDTSLTEWTPFARYFLFKESDDQTPVTLAAQAQFVQGRAGGEQRVWYVLAGGQLYKRLQLGDGFALYPFVGFSLAGESYGFGGVDPERSLYLTRQFGVHGLFTLGADSWLRLSVEEHSFRRETFRAVRAAVVVR